MDEDEKGGALGLRVAVHSALMNVEGISFFRGLGFNDYVQRGFDLLHRLEQQSSGFIGRGSLALFLKRSVPLIGNSMTVEALDVNVHIISFEPRAVATAFFADIGSRLPRAPGS